MADIETEVKSLTKDKVENLETGPTMAPLKEPTKAKILEVVALLQRKEQNGGYRGIAQTVGDGMKPSQVKQIHMAMKTRLAELAAQEIE
jgi:hypothetical protein